MQVETWKLDRFQTVLNSIQIAQLELSSFAEFAHKLKGLFPTEKTYELAVRNG